MSGFPQRVGLVINLSLEEDNVRTTVKNEVVNKKCRFEMQFFTGLMQWYVRRAHLPVMAAAKKVHSLPSVLETLQWQITSPTGYGTNLDGYSSKSQIRLDTTQIRVDTTQIRVDTTQF